MEKKKPSAENAVNLKRKDLAPDTVSDQGKLMTTNLGLKINDDTNSLKAGERGAIFTGRFYSEGKNNAF